MVPQLEGVFLKVGTMGSMESTPYLHMQNTVDTECVSKE